MIVTSQRIKQFENTCRLVRSRLSSGQPTKWSTIHKKYLTPYTTRERIGEAQWGWQVTRQAFREFSNKIHGEMLAQEEARVQRDAAEAIADLPGAEYMDFCSDFDPKGLNVTRFKPQLTAARHLLSKCLVEQHCATMLYGGTGTGKTFVAGYFLKGILESGILKQFNIHTPWPILFVTKKPAVDQTIGVFKLQFGLDTVNDITVINYEAFLSKVRERYITTKTVVKNGEAEMVLTWNPGISPYIIFWDECQSTKNEKAQITKIARAYSEFKGHPTFQVFCSATHYTSVAEAKTMCLAMKFPIV